MNETNKSSPVPIRLPKDMDQKITAVAEKLGRSKQETMRLCLDYGLKWLEAHNFDLEEKIVPIHAVEMLRTLIVDAVDRLTKETDRLSEVPAASVPRLRVASDIEKYKTKKK